MPPPPCVTAGAVVPLYSRLPSLTAYAFSSYGVVTRRVRRFRPPGLQLADADVGVVAPAALARAPSSRWQLKRQQTSEAAQTRDAESAAVDASTAADRATCVGDRAHTRNAVLSASVDLVAASLEARVDLVSQRDVAPSDPHRDVEHERKERRIDLRRDRRDVSGTLCPVAKYPASGPQTTATSTSPRATASTMRARRIRLGVIAVDAVAPRLSTIPRRPVPAPAGS